MPDPTGAVLLPADLEKLLQEFRQLDAWISSAASDDLRAMLSARRTAVALGLAEGLARFTTESADREPVATPTTDARPGTHGLPASPRPASGGAPSPEALPAPADRPAPPRAPPLPRFPLPARSEPAERITSPTYPSTAQSRVRTPAATVRAAPASEWSSLAAGLVAELWPADASDPIDAAAAAIEASDRWCELPSEGQRLLASCAAARLHVLEERVPGDPRVNNAFSMLSAFMKRARPGYVNGLARTHRPEHGSWQKDAEYARAALLAAMGGRGPAPASPTEAELSRVRSLCLDAQVAPGDLRDAVMASLRRDVRAMLTRGVDPSDTRLQGLLGDLVDELDLPELDPTR